jgi:hypothetical protein
MNETILLRWGMRWHQSFSFPAYDQFMPFSYTEDSVSTSTRSWPIQIDIHPSWKEMEHGDNQQQQTQPIHWLTVFKGRNAMKHQAWNVRRRCRMYTDAFRQGTCSAAFRVNTFCHYYELFACMELQIWVVSCLSQALPWLLHGSIIVCPPAIVSLPAVTFAWTTSLAFFMAGDHMAVSDFYFPNKVLHKIQSTSSSSANGNKRI